MAVRVRRCFIHYLYAPARPHRFPPAYLSTHAPCCCCAYATHQVYGGCDHYYSDSDEYEEAAETAPMIKDDGCWDWEVNFIWHSPQSGRLGAHVGDFGLGMKLIQNSVLGGEQLFPEDRQPDQKKYEPYTGNEGPSLTYWYRRALVVVWPRSRSPIDD